jgi:hypothetical protein
MTGQSIFNIVAGTGLVVLAGSQTQLFRALFAAARDRTIRVVVDIEAPLGGRTQLSPEDLARAAEGWHFGGDLTAITHLARRD